MVKEKTVAEATEEKPKTEALTDKEKAEVKDSIERGVGPGKNWADMKELADWIERKCLFNSDEIIFGVTAKRLLNFLKK